MLEVGARRNGDEASPPRYTRWPALDKQGGSDACACWLDRRTGLLLYQSERIDPNSTVATDTLVGSAFLR